VAAALCTALVSPPAWAQTAASVSDLVGMRSATAPAELRARGYTLVHTDNSGETSGPCWWNGARSDCALYTMNGGKVERLDTADEHDCIQPAASASATHCQMQPARQRGLRHPARRPDVARAEGSGGHLVSFRALARPAAAAGRRDGPMRAQLELSAACTSPRLPLVKEPGHP